MSDFTQNFDNSAAIAESKPDGRRATTSSQDRNFVYENKPAEKENVASPQSQQEARLKEFREGSILSTQLGKTGIPERKKLVGDWFCEADLSFVFARRGLGKTWFSLGLACAIASKTVFGQWKVHENLPVLYVDGEMPCEIIHERISGLGLSDSLSVLNHEALFHKTGAVLNLTDPVSQEAIKQLCLEGGYRVLVLDNLSCLFSGVKENEADAWEKVLPWLLELRRHRIAVVIVAHSGRDGKSMRGTSRREDAAFSVIRLDDPPESGELKNGAQFLLRFTKDRNSRIEQSAMEWTFQTLSDGCVHISTKCANSCDVLIQWVRDGLTSATEIGKEMGVSTGTVSKMFKKLEKEGRLKIEGREYKLP
jgi:hypothetical protein